MRDIFQLTKVNLGCGNDATPDYLNVDIRENTLADVVADVRKLPFSDGRFDEVFSCDCLEHISHRDTHDTLTEWVRVLSIGGKITIIVPNIMKAFKILGDNNPDYGAVINILYGAQDYELNCHKMGFTPKYLAELLEQHGIEVDRIEESGLHIKIKGTKR